MRAPKLKKKGWKERREGGVRKSGMAVNIINPIAVETDTAYWLASLLVSSWPEVDSVWSNNQGWPPASTSTSTDMHMNLHIQVCL